jgi:hypothetical protein
MPLTDADREKALRTRRENKAKRDAAKAAKEGEQLEPPPKVDPKLEYEFHEPPQAEIDPAKPETIPANYLSGFVKRLDVFGDKPGFVRRWFNDDKGGSNIAAALASGWRFSERQEVQLNAAVTPRNTDLGSRVQECVGTNENGNALFAYLMEIPQWLFDKHQEARIAYHNQLREQIAAGTLGAKANDGRYSAANPPRGGTKLPPISLEKPKFYR